MRRAIASIDEASWVRIEYRHAVLDSDTGELVSAAEVAEVPYAFTSHRTPVQGRLIVHRVPERNTTKLADAALQGLFPVWRYHAIFTNNPGSQIEAESQLPGHDRRAGHRRPQSRAAGAPALEVVPGQRCMAGCGHDRVQPDPRDRGHRGREAHQGRRRTVQARIINTPARVS